MSILKTVGEIKTPENDHETAIVSVHRLQRVCKDLSEHVGVATYVRARFDVLLEAEGGGLVVTCGITASDNLDEPAVALLIGDQLIKALAEFQNRREAACPKP